MKRFSTDDYTGQPKGGSFKSNSKPRIKQKSYWNKKNNRNSSNQSLKNMLTYASDSDSVLDYDGRNYE